MSKEKWDREEQEAKKKPGLFISREWCLRIWNTGQHLKLDCPKFLSVCGEVYNTHKGRKETSICRNTPKREKEDYDKMLYTDSFCLCAYSCLMTTRFWQSLGVFMRLWIAFVVRKITASFCTFGEVSSLFSFPTCSCFYI